MDRKVAKRRVDSHWTTIQFKTLGMIIAGRPIRRQDDTFPCHDIIFRRDSTSARSFCVSRLRYRCIAISETRIYVCILCGIDVAMCGQVVDRKGDVRLLYLVHGNTCQLIVSQSEIEVLSMPSAMGRDLRLIRLTCIHCVAAPLSRLSNAPYHHQLSTPGPDIYRPDSPQPPLFYPNYALEHHPFSTHASLAHRSRPAPVFLRCTFVLTHISPRTAR